jgi:hypothetical protein
MHVRQGLDEVKAKVEEKGDYTCEVTPVRLDELFPRQQRPDYAEGEAQEDDGTRSCCLLFDQVIDLRHFTPLEDFSFVVISRQLIPPRMRGMSQLAD